MHQLARGTYANASDWSGIWILNIAVTIAIVALDWLTPAGIVVGILLCVPIVLTSMADSARIPWVTFAVATVGFILAAAYGSGPLSPAIVWQPNRAFAFLTVPASLWIALLIQRRRREAELARDDAVASRDLSRLLTSLIAHDVRAPLAMAVETLEYARASGPDFEPDPALIADVQARLRRNLGAVDTLVRFVRAEIDGTDAMPMVAVREAAHVLETQAAGFHDEALANGQDIRVETRDLAHAGGMVDPLVMRHATAIVLDNAIRHSAGGRIEVIAAADEDRLTVRIESSGSLDRNAGATHGSGVGLGLCQALVGRAGGSVELTETVSTVRVTFTLPIHTATRDAIA